MPADANSRHISALAPFSIPQEQETLPPTTTSTIPDDEIKHHARSSEQSTTGAMPFQLDTPVLTVDKGIIHKVDTGNPQNLFSMWTGE